MPTSDSHARALSRRLDVTEHGGIPVTTVVRTLIDIAARLALKQRERAINEADRLGLVDPDALRQAIATDPRRLHNAHVLRDTLDRRTFSKTIGATRDPRPPAEAPRTLTQPC
jgi:hypothetical protein